MSALFLLALDIGSDRGHELNKSGLFLLGLLFASQPASAISPSWIINPKVCLASEIADQCEMLLKITFADLPAGEYCLFQDGIEIKCFAMQKAPSQQKIRYRETTSLSLRDEYGIELLHQKLSVKARQRQTVKRRVRQPWSLF